MSRMFMRAPRYNKDATQHERFQISQTLQSLSDESGRRENSVADTHQKSPNNGENKRGVGQHLSLSLEKGP